MLTCSFRSPFVCIKTSQWNWHWLGEWGWGVRKEKVERAKHVRGGPSFRPLLSPSTALLRPGGWSSFLLCCCYYYCSAVVFNNCCSCKKVAVSERWIANDGRYLHISRSRTQFWPFFCKSKLLKAPLDSRKLCYRRCICDCSLTQEKMCELVTKSTARHIHKLTIEQGAIVPLMFFFNQWLIIVRLSSMS